MVYWGALRRPMRSLCPVMAGLGRVRRDRDKETDQEGRQLNQSEFSGTSLVPSFCRWRGQAEQPTQPIVPGAAWMRLVGPALYRGRDRGAASVDVV